MTTTKTFLRGSANSYDTPFYVLLCAISLFTHVPYTKPNKLPYLTDNSYSSCDMNPFSLLLTDTRIMTKV